MNELGKITVDTLDGTKLAGRTNERRGADVVLPVEVGRRNDANLPAISAGALNGMSQGAIGANYIGVANSEYSTRQCHRRILPERCAESGSQR